MTYNLTRALRVALLAALLAISTVGVIAAFTPTRASACTYGPASMAVWANDPVRSGTYVKDVAGIDSNPSPSCGVTQQTNWLTKACGAFGCSYETQAQSSNAAPTSNHFVQSAQKACRKGLNRYWTKSVANNVGGPGYQSVKYSANQPEFSC